ncbi:hypothetical protein MHK_008483 [Candidatus Magnetomorum sp. HK-1]|nr:hypothetical protein MHK_008483 [Candidatus Magnetomorum sp. HK-1]
MKQYKIPTNKQIRIALAATQRPILSACPSENTMAAFIDRRLDSKSQLEMWEHIDVCPSCFQAWKDVQSIIVKKPGLPIFLQQSFALPLAASIIISLIGIQLYQYFQKPDFEALIVAMYEEPMIQQQTSKSILYKTIDRPEKKMSSLIGDPSQTSPYNAFLSGLKNTENETLRSTNELKNYYYLGRWFLALHSSLLGNTNYHITEHLHIIDYLNQHSDLFLSKQHFDIVTKSINNIQSAISNGNLDKPTVQSEVNSLINQLFISRPEN